MKTKMKIFYLRSPDGRTEIDACVGCKDMSPQCYLTCLDHPAGLTEDTDYKKIVTEISNTRMDELVKRIDNTRIDIDK